MTRQTAIQAFAILAVLVGLLVSYHPPGQNAGAIWGMVTMFIGYCIRDLFTDPKQIPDKVPPTPAQADHL